MREPETTLRWHRVAGTRTVFVDARLDDVRVFDRSERVIGRLEHLERLRLGERVQPGVWELADGWQRPLRDLGERGDLVKQMHERVSRGPERSR
jgi:hypothetical protein